jgi:uncharacterized protein (TIGR02001 family)
MKKILMITASVLLLMTFIPFANAQEEEKESLWNAGLDIYSSYIWRGLKFGTGVAFQPSVDFTAGGFTVGAWGSFSTGSEEAAEADLYAGYSFSLGEKISLGITVTDYYFPGNAYFAGESHYIEPLVSLGIGAFTFTAAYMEGMGDDAINSTSDVYLQAAFTKGIVSLTVGGGDGQYSIEEDDEEDKFAISNIGIGIAKEIKITDSFGLPLSGAVILNPSSEQLYVVVGISF